MQNKKIRSVKLWRVDVPPRVFLDVVGEEEVKNLNPISMNKFHVIAANQEVAFAKAWNIIKDSKVLVSKEDIRVGEYPSVIDCVIR